MKKEEIQKAVGQRIKEIRLRRGLSQIDLAGKIEGKIDTTNISRIESGKTNPTLFLLYRIAKALGVSVKELVDAEKLNL